MIGRSAGHTAEAPREDELLHELPRDHLIERLAFHDDQFNYLHPFREGNGRTQRIFWSRVARDAGYVLDWRTVQESVNDAACHAAAEDRDLGPLRTMFDTMVSETP